MLTTTQRFRALSKEPRTDEGSREAPILPFPFTIDSDGTRRPRAALRPLTKPRLPPMDITPLTPLASPPRSEPRARADATAGEPARDEDADLHDELRALGLAEPPRKGRIARFFVSTYRLVGFAILTVVVLVLVSYLSNAIFFYASDSWIAPVTVSSNDERVVSARTALLAQQDVRDRTAAELAQTERAITAHRAFQTEFARAIASDREDRRATLARLRALAGSAATARAQLTRTTDAYAKTFAQKIEQEHAAGLIDRNTVLSGKYQLGQIQSAKLTLAERQAEYELRAAEIAAEMRALESIIARDERGPDGGAAASYEVLKIKRELETSRLELAKAMADREVLATSLERQEKAIEAIESSPFLRAAAEDATVAMVPYGNLDNVAAGVPVYACRLSFVWCREVGRVKEVLRGEVTFDHPRRDSNLRGHMVALELVDGEAIREDVLFVGGKPLSL